MATTSGQNTWVRREAIDQLPLCSRSENEDNAIQTLPSEKFDQSDLCSCLLASSSGAFQSRAARQLLGYLAQNNTNSIPLTVAKELGLNSVKMMHNHVADVSVVGATISESNPKSASELWILIRETNMPDSETGDLPKAFGRVLQIRFLPPIVALQLLTSLRAHFDIERLFSTLISPGLSTGYNPHLDTDPGAKYFWSFTMKYYYINIGKSDVYEGQVIGIFHEKEEDLYICRGTALVALSFAANHNSGAFYAVSTLTPWRLVILSCNRQTEQRRGKLRSGVEAFLWGVNHELAWVKRSLRHVSNEIALLAAPSDEFLFDKTLRESLLFEDQTYSNSRTYFWALQSLRTINNSINSLISAWNSYDKSSLLDIVRISEEQQQHTAASESPASNTGHAEPNADVNFYLTQIERQMEQLAEIVKHNNTKQEEIQSLRDGLFNASAVLEARTTVLQGRNIQILTLISMIFLPASFVTSLFSMSTIMPASMGPREFGILISVICGLTYLIIIGLNFGGGGLEAIKKLVRGKIRSTSKYGTQSRWWIWSNSKTPRREKGEEVEKGE